MMITLGKNGVVEGVVMVIWVVGIVENMISDGVSCYRKSIFPRYGIKSALSSPRWTATIIV